MTVLATGIAIEGAIKYKLDWIDEFDFKHFLGKNSLDQTILIHLFQHQNVMAFAILVFVFVAKKFIYSQTRVEAFEPELGSKTISLQKFEIENKYNTMKQKR